jgi:DNA invertase Pin-like site-specific DNA recombinase
MIAREAATVSIFCTVRIFREKLSGANRERPEFQRMLDQLCNGDGTNVLAERTPLLTHEAHAYR